MAPEISAFGRLIEIKDAQPEKSAIANLRARISQVGGERFGASATEASGARKGIMASKTFNKLLDAVQVSKQVLKRKF